MRMQIPKEPMPLEEAYQIHSILSQCHIEEDKLIRDWDTWLLKAFFIFLITLFVMYMFPGGKPIEDLFPTLTLIGACSTVTLLATNVVTSPIERRRASIEKKGGFIEKQYFEITSFKYFRVVSEEKAFRFKNEISLRLLPFLCSAGGTIASATALHIKNGGNLTFLVPAIGSESSYEDSPRCFH